MCRHLAYLGPPTALSDLLFDAPHALARQAECPRLQTSGTTNPDGWGVAWYVDGDTTPDRYRTLTPIWEDRTFADRAHDLRSGAFLAAARLASPGASLVDTGTAQSVAGRSSWVPLIIARCTLGSRLENCGRLGRPFRAVRRRPCGPSGPKTRQRRLEPPGLLSAAAGVMTPSRINCAWSV
jgi:hypothetical protein